MLEQLDIETANRDLTSSVTVLTDTPDATGNRWCQGLIMLGDGTDNLDGTGGDFEVTVTIGGQTWDGGPTVKTLGTAVRSCILTEPFMVPANAAVVIAVKSPNVADDDVAVTAYLFAVDGANVRAINGSTSAARKQGKAADVIVEGTVDTSVLSPSTTVFEADDITYPSADHLNGRVPIFTTGNLVGQATSVVDYSLETGKGRLTVVGLTAAPSNGDEFIIL
jgi:hypothetical protein